MDMFGRHSPRRWRNGICTMCAVALAIAALQFNGCGSVAYYGQAISGHFNILAQQQPIPKLLGSNDTPPELQHKLSLVLRVRAFASKALLLPGNKSYSSYADLKRPYVSWNVFAAPEFSLAAEEWCFPFAGCVRYRAYFSQQEAEHFAADLERRGYDVYVSGVAAYSTLGWFSDPVLNTFVNDSDANVARLIFHELAHQKLYVKNDSAFNEAFAVAVERAGLRRWLEAEGHDQDRDRLVRCWTLQDALMDQVGAARAELAQLYVSPLPLEAKRAHKVAILTRLQEQLGPPVPRKTALSGSRSWPVPRINNAYLVALGTYYAYLPAFETLLRELNGNLAAFYHAAAELGRLPERQRSARLQKLAEKVYVVEQEGTSDTAVADQTS
jgi:predicted aminopeptidase